MTARHPHADPRSLVANTPVLVAGAHAAVWLGPDGTVATVTPEGARAKALAGTPPMLCHAPATMRRLDGDPFPSLDVLELFAFVRPAQFCLPTVRGLAAAAGLALPVALADQAVALREAASTLLAELARPDYPRADEAAAIVRRMAHHGWPWAAAAGAALGRTGAADRLDVWTRLPEWSDQAPQPAPEHFPVEPDEARGRLAALLGPGAEARPQQADYASAAALAFQPRDDAMPGVVVAEAGTGVGKTLGYIAPASVWVDKNGGAVWLSTFTKNLQAQIDRELDRLYPDAAEKARKVVVRKGRENYFCLLNFEEAVGRLSESAPPGFAGAGAAYGLLARWARHSRDGDMVGGDFPGWLADLAGRSRVHALTDRRGECVYSACPHWRKCFIERAHRKARHADLVIANHALVMALAAAGDDEPSMPGRYVFDEGHHLFGAADSAFASHLSGLETRELRRWLCGAEGARRGRARGLRRRAGDLVEGDQRAAEALDTVVASARALPRDGWLRRVSERRAEGPCERFLAFVHQQVSVRAAADKRGYSLETDARPAVDGLLDAADALDAALGDLAGPLVRLEAALLERLDEEADALDSATRLRLDATARSLRRRRLDLIAPWRAMLKSLAGTMPEAFVDWFAIARHEGQARDVGMYRHWVDPTEPFAAAVLGPSQGALITSASLRDGTGDAEADWRAAEMRTGAAHLPAPAVRAQVPSPFDYRAHTRVFVVNDVNRDDPAQVAAAYRSLFLASNGGALGLFTAIGRLRAVHERIAGPLDDAGLPLLAQHVDGLDAATLTAIFRAEQDACLLGTDALRDGVDVPGRALRLIVFDRVPWPRPDILHRARRARFGGRHYDDLIARLRLKQAFGRLVRRADDRGVFVILDAAMPSRLLGAFPPETEAVRTGLADAVTKTRAFVGLPPARVRP